MIDKLLKKFSGRFQNHLPISYHSTTLRPFMPLLPSYTLKDTFDGEIFTIKIDSLAADPELVLENVLNEKIINKRDYKIEQLINETKTQKNW